MQRLKIHRVRRVPPIPTTTIVIPNVQLSMFFIFIYLPMMYGKAFSELGNPSFPNGDQGKRRMIARRGPPERRRCLKVERQNR
jgi:hypothetical protein